MRPLDAEIKKQPGGTPGTALVWPAKRHTENKIQQIKGFSKPQIRNLSPSTQTNQPLVAARTLPAHVTHVRIITRPSVNGQKTVTVQFTQPHNDPYYGSVNVFLRRAGANQQQPAQVAGGATSPLTFTVPVNQAPHVVHVVTTGLWGSNDILTSPSRPVKLT